MTTEAEQLASEMQRYGVTTMNRWACDGATLIRSQAAEIDRLRAEANTCGAGAGCCAQAAEIERLRAAQAHAVIPLIGPLLDAWECCSQDVRSEHPELDKQLRRINRVMEDAAVDATVVLELISQIERLTAEANTCGAGAGCCAQAAEIERLTAEAELFAKHVGLKLACKDALLRECLTVLSASYAENYDEALELRLEANIKEELGER